MNPQENATDRELDQFYGTPPTEAQVQESIARFTEAFDADDLATIASYGEEVLLPALASGDLLKVGLFMSESRKALIAGWVSKELYGKTGVITAKDIK